MNVCQRNGFNCFQIFYTHFSVCYSIRNESIEKNVSIRSGFFTSKRHICPFKRTKSDITSATFLNYDLEKYKEDQNCPQKTYLLKKRKCHCIRFYISVCGDWLKNPFLFFKLFKKYRKCLNYLISFFLIIFQTYAFL